MNLNFDVALWIVKFFHVSAIALWAGGLLSLPFLFRQRSEVTGDEQHRLHRMARFLYVRMVSPSAFVAVGTGTGLIFMRETFVEWFSAKLLAVGVLVMMHVLTGLLLLKLFKDEQPVGFGRFRSGGLTLVNLGAVTAVLYLVLAKPDWDAGTTAALFQPGGLKDFVMPLIASVIP